MTFKKGLKTKRTKCENTFYRSVYTVHVHTQTPRVGPCAVDSGKTEQRYAIESRTQQRNNTILFPHVNAFASFSYSTIATTTAHNNDSKISAIYTGYHSETVIPVQ